MGFSLKPGDAAPDFSGKTTDGKTVSLADYRGKTLVLYFYPKAFTSGCTLETKRFQDSYPDITEFGADVLGVSRDRYEVQCDFASKLATTFPLLADEDGEVARAYGVRRALLPFDKRSTFVIDPEGKVAAVIGGAREVRRTPCRWRHSGSRHGRSR